MNVRITVQGIAAEALAQVASRQGWRSEVTPALPVEAFVATVLFREPTPPDHRVLRGLYTAAAEHDFQWIGMRTLAQSPAVFEVALRGAPTHEAELRRTLAGSVTDVDTVLQRESPARRYKRLLVMDVDSTLIRQEVIDEIARAADCYEQVAAVTARAMNGEMSFEQSLRARVQQLVGVPVSVLEEVRGRVELTAGAQSLISGFQALGGRVAVISGGFIQVLEPMRRALGIDYAFANTLEIDDGRLTGRVTGALVDGARKADLLQTIALTERVGLPHTVAVGDGANDLEMLGLAGLGVAFHAKPRVKTAAPHSLDHPRLDALFYLMGLSDAEIDTITAASAPPSSR